MAGTVKRPPVAIVVAMAENLVIGRGNALPWRLPADLARFRAVTMGKPIVMGRRTYESIGRVLDGRHNIVVSRRPGFRAPGCTVAASLGSALEAASDTAAAEIAVIGGAGLYEEALPHATRVYLTLVHAVVDGDVWFLERRLRGARRERVLHALADGNVRLCELVPGAWREVSRTGRGADARNPYAMSFIELERVASAQR